MRPHVLVARLDNNGDVLLAGPAIRAVAGSAGLVTLLCGPRGADAGGLLPGIDEIVTFRAPWIDPEPEPVDPVAIESLIDDLRDRQIDQAIILTSFHQSPLPLALVLRMAAVPQIAAISEDYPGSLLDVRHQVPDNIHEVERNLSLVGTLGYRLPAADDGRLRIKRAPPGQADVPYVVVHPGATAPSRTWPASRHAALVRALADSGRRVVVTGGPFEQALTHEVAGEHPRVTNLGGRIDFGQLADVIAGADTLVAGNTGPAHLAAAVGTPVVSLFSPVVPAERWRPWRVPQVLLGDQHAPCAGSRARVCPVAGHPCLSDVRVDQVIDAIERLTAGSVVMAS